MESMPKQESSSAEVRNNFLEKRLTLLSAVYERLLKKYWTPEMQDFLKKTVSFAANYTPVVGNIKLSLEAVRGETAGGVKLNRRDRATYGFATIASLLSYVAFGIAAENGHMDSAKIGAALQAVSYGLPLATSEFKEAWQKMKNVTMDAIINFLDAANNAISQAPPHVRALMDTKIA